MEEKPTIIKDMLKDAITKPEINFLLSILIPLTSLAVAWGVITARVDHVEKMVTGLQDKQQQQIDSQLRVNEDIKIRLAEMQKDILYIRATIDKEYGIDAKK